MAFHRNIAEAFENRVRLGPEKTAVVSGGKQHSYGTLNEKANRMAHYLIQKGLQGAQIGISLPRSENIIAAILGVLKAGCAYVFLDPQYPPERIQYILQHSGIKMLLSSGTAPVFIPGPKVSIVDPEICWSSGTGSENPGVVLSADSDAYIMYTSGSTGRPKGSVITHGNVLRYIEAINQVVQLQEGDRYLHTASFSFSSSVRQYLLPLLNGIPLVMADERSAQSLMKLLQLARDSQITIMDNVRSLWQYGVIQLERFQQHEKDALAGTGVRLIIFSGELLPFSLVSQLRSFFPSGKSPSIINLYGQTETIGGVAYTLPRDLSHRNGWVPVGSPLSNTRVHLLDQSMKPVSRGEYGEVFISGPSVGKGYFNNRAQTEEHFIRHKGEGEIAVTLFRTGDIARHSDDGLLEINGRRDFQVKIRGIRIETAEIENALNGHPDIAESIVVAFEDESRETKLAAFLVKRSNKPLDQTLLKNYLKKMLPDAFIPGRFMKTDAIPLLPNGKTDRKTLAEMAAYQRPADHKPAPHENEVQKTVHSLFAQILGDKAFGVTESFFDLGGHSLKAVELIELLEQIFSKKIPVDLIYRYPSVKQLASAIEKIRSVPVTSNLACIQPLGHLPAFFGVHCDDANFFLPRFLGRDIPFYGFFHQGQNGERIRHDSIPGMAGKYIAEMAKVRHKAPYILGGYSIGGVIAFEMANQLVSKGQPVALLFLIDSLCPGYHGRVMAGKHVFNRTESSHDHNTATTAPARPVSRIKQKLQEKWFEIAYYPSLLLAMLNIKVPLTLRNSYIMGVYHRARKDYRPRGPVPYQTVLFRSAIYNYDDYFLGWKPYMQDNITVYELEATHQSIIAEPGIRIVAERIAKIMADKFSK